MKKLFSLDKLKALVAFILGIIGGTQLPIDNVTDLLDKEKRNETKQVIVETVKEKVKEEVKPKLDAKVEELKDKAKAKGDELKDKAKEKMDGLFDKLKKKDTDGEDA